jgi:hypothetical protein
MGLSLPVINDDALSGLIFNEPYLPGALPRAIDNALSGLVFNAPQKSRGVAPGY